MGTSVLETLFTFLFKYPLLVFQQGDFTWGVSRVAMLAIVAVTALAVAALVTYRGAAEGTERPLRDRVVLVALRSALLLILLFCLLRPTLMLKASVPQQNFVGVLVDDSRSMTIADVGGQPRTTFVQQQLSAPGAKLAADLSKKFVLRYFTFSSSADRVASPAALRYNGTSTRLGPALERARDELAGLPLAGLVLVTDGADTSDATLDAPLASLKARQIPVFPVGLGQERFSKDIQVTRVETPASVLKGTSLVVDVVLTQTGYAGRSVPLTVEDSGHIVDREDVTLPGDGESSTVRVHFMANDAGPRVFRFSVAPQDGEQVTQNNVRDALIEVQDRVEKVLYYEGEPRFEYKFIRRAVQDDKNLQVVGLDRTAENKYYRQGVSNPDEHAGGFPKTREELFAYRAIILGSIEAAAFTPEQQRMLADFVNKRGGGLLMLGGRRSFAEGGWAGTPVAEALPVVLDSRRQPSYFSELSVEPTRAGALFPVTQIADTEEASLAKWQSMPQVSTVNPIHEAKPGATVLLTAPDKNQQQIVLAYQRYGRGKTIAFPIQDSYLWRMDAKIPVTDTTHTMFWRRMVRWLVDAVPDQVNISTARDRFEPGESVRLTAEVLDAAYSEVNDAQVEAEVTSPSGKTTALPMEWTVEHDGEYGAAFGADEPGLYAITVTATRDGKAIGTSVKHIRVSAGDAEYFDANMRAPLLKRIADETGGRFFTAADASQLPDAISYSGRGVTIVEERDLWDMPILLILALALMAAEWGYRRSRGLA
jgi:uncharacterized membrane protein